MRDRCCADPGQMPTPLVPSLCLSGGSGSGLGTLPLLAGESKDRSPHRGPSVSQGLPMRSGMKGEYGLC